MRRPEFITFTGADDATGVQGMLALAERFPIEWGILFSASRQGLDPRYPRDPYRFIGHGLALSAHLCGTYAELVVEGVNIKRIWAELPSPPQGFHAFERLQVNHRAPDARRIAEFGWAIGAQCIAQARGEVFPKDASIAWLFDRSGGTGAAPESWPRHPGGGRLVGYAGGIGPANVREVIAAIDSTGPYWLDMESGVRADDWFDLELCRRVCEAVYA